MEQKALLERLEKLEAEIAELKARPSGAALKDTVTLICFSGEWDKLFAALTIANGALALGQEVHMFFTFWAVNALRRERNGEEAVESGEAAEKGDLGKKLMKLLMKAGVKNAPLSHFNMGGLGKSMLRSMMKKEGVEDLGYLLEQARELGAHFHLCETSSGMFGLKCEELWNSDELNSCGVATFLSYALNSRVSLFI